jgi:hypothetical protein
MWWNIFVLFTIVVIVTLIGFNVKNLIVKMIKYPQSIFDMLTGVVISLLAIAGLIYIFIQTLGKLNL